MAPRCLTALPVYNEARYVGPVLELVRRHSEHVLVVDDGSTDGTGACLAELATRLGLDIVTHPANQGYGAALQSAFTFAIDHQFDRLVTIDCDGQHEPQRIPEFLEALDGCDIVSGSRYLHSFAGDSEPPAQRRWINQQITAQLNRRLGLQLTDAFCGFKAYQVSILPQLRTAEPGYAMPLELWVLAARAGLKILELPVPLIYLDESRSFGGALDDGTTRLNYYLQILDRSIEACGLPSKVRSDGIGCGKGPE
jgi:glycosyltransferase involved in cell wall biosynthesis